MQSSNFELLLCIWRMLLESELLPTIVSLLRSLSTAVLWGLQKVSLCCSQLFYFFILFYFICHTNYKKYRKRRRRKKKKKWRGDLTETIGAYERLGLLELPALSANWPFDRNSGVLLCHKPTRTLHLGQVVVLRNRLRRWLNKCVLTN